MTNTLRYGSRRRRRFRRSQLNNKTRRIWRTVDGNVSLRSAAGVQRGVFARSGGGSRFTQSRIREPSSVDRHTMIASSNASRQQR